MNKEQATKILGVSPSAKRREINAAFEAPRRQYVMRAQHSPAPDERDVATKALATVQDAYHELTGDNAPARLNRVRSAKAASASTIPRASLGGTRS